MDELEEQGGGQCCHNNGVWGMPEPTTWSLQKDSKTKGSHLPRAGSQQALQSQPYTFHLGPHLSIQGKTSPTS